ENGYLTPSLKLKRNLVTKDFSEQIEALYTCPGSSLLRDESTQPHLPAGQHVVLRHAEDPLHGMRKRCAALDLLVEADQVLLGPPLADVDACQPRHGVGAPGIGPGPLGSHVAPWVRPRLRQLVTAHRIERRTGDGHRCASGTAL